MTWSVEEWQCIADRQELWFFMGAESSFVDDIDISVLPGGAIRAEEALHYVRKHRGIEAIVSGASSRENIKRTISIIDRRDAKYAISAA